MKCLVLAGGVGEKLWPLSRKNFPKQFIKVQKNHSLFQETIARNLAYCDEFVIVTNYEYRFIIANQMETFQGVPYRCIYEEEPRKTTAAIILACLDLQPSEYVFVVATDHLINTTNSQGLSYKDSILNAKDSAREGYIVLFGQKADKVIERFGYFTRERFYEKPDWRVIKELNKRDDLYLNLGVILFQNGVMLNELRRTQPEIFKQCSEVYRQREILSEGVLYRAEVQRLITSISIEHSIFEHTNKLMGIETGFEWSDVGSLEDLSKTEYQADGVAIQNECAHTVILNQASNQSVVVNDLDNVLVVNTSDSIYIGRRGKSHLLKQILHDNPALDSFSEQSTIFYRYWGYYEQLLEENGYRIRKVVISPGKTIFEHTHKERKENCTIVEGTALIKLNGQSKIYTPPDNLDITAGTSHQISNVSEQPLVIIETAVGESVHGGDFTFNNFDNVTESDLGLQVEPMIKLSPAFKDYLWGGTKLRDIYGKQCDFDTIAESWELSAHSAGNSIIASGRHKGSTFSKYLEVVGKQVLGWKCIPLQAFPLLIKFIDAKQNLSVQVHPNDDYALENENEYGKNEMWYVIDSEPGAGLYLGFNRDVTREEVEQRIAANTIMDVLNFYPTKAGDVFFIPAGTVHAIGAGNLICEIQQSSNSTYRLYDYDRRDKFGNARELHLQKALDVLTYKKYEAEGIERSNGKVSCKYFEVDFVHGESRMKFEDDSFHSVTCINGSGTLSLNESVMNIHAGETIFIPATNDSLITTGNASLIIAKI